MTILDQDGVELADVAEAVREAVRRGREVTRQNAVKVMPLSTARVIVEDEWRTIFEVPLDDVNTGSIED